VKKSPNLNYHDLIAWNKAYALALAIDQKTSKFPAEEKYGLTFQTREAGVSVPSNIAEGEERNSSAEFRHCLAIALGSVKETKIQVFLSRDLGFLESENTEQLLAMASEVARLINERSRSFVNY
jgi:four helix bundle protein